jgi:lactoylglutathione lyase
MRTLHVGLRVSNLDPSLAFYRAIGYTVTGTVEGCPFTGFRDLVSGGGGEWR